MEIAGGALGWSEDEFWSSSLQYFYAALDGWMEINGSKKNEIDELDYADFKTENTAELSMTDDDLRRIREKGNG